MNQPLFSVRDFLHRRHKDEGNRIADRLVKIISTWRFLFGVLGCMQIWMISNTLLGTHAIDPPPQYNVMSTFINACGFVMNILILIATNTQSELLIHKAQQDLECDLEIAESVKQLSAKLDKIG